MKFCTNCRHFDNDDARPEPVCRRDKVINMITGKDDFGPCRGARADETLCGKAASWFEPKEGAGAVSDAQP